jgi:hypothetical protein
MRVEYGPPGHKGVTQIMGLGATPSIAMIDKNHRNVGLLALATWVGGVVAGSDTARNIGIGGLLAVVYVQVLARREEAAAPAPLPPIDVQGWG